MQAPTKGTIHDPTWRAFAAWCRRLALCPLPAHPWTVGAFLRWCEERPGAVAVAEAVVAIAAVHTRRGYARPERHVIVRRTLAALARRRGNVPGSCASRATQVRARIPGPAASGAAVLFRAKDFATSCEGTPIGVTCEGTPIGVTCEGSPAGTTREGTAAGMTRALSPAPKLVARRQYRTAH